MPPTEDPYATANNNAVVWRVAVGFSVEVLCAPRAATATAMATGSIMAVVAVLLIHIDTNAGATIRPANTRRGELPHSCSTVSAKRRCKPCSCIAAPMHMPPKNSPT